MRQEVERDTRGAGVQPVPAKRSLIQTLGQSVGENVENFRRHVGRSRREAFVREIAAEARRDELWLEAIERERSQAREIESVESVESVESEGLRNAAASKGEAVLVAHSGGSGEALERLAREGAYLTDVVSDGGSEIEKTWLLFRSSKEAPRRERRRL
jgi:hypothetical protein